MCCSHAPDCIATVGVEGCRIATGVGCFHLEPVASRIAEFVARDLAVSVLQCMDGLADVVCSHVEKLLGDNRGVLRRDVHIVAEQEVEEIRRRSVVVRCTIELDRCNRCRHQTSTNRRQVGNVVVHKDMQRKRVDQLGCLSHGWQWGRRMHRCMDICICTCALCMHMCMDMCIKMCLDMCMDMCKGYVHGHVHGHVQGHVQWTCAWACARDMCMGMCMDI